MLLAVLGHDMKKRDVLLLAFIAALAAAMALFLQLRRGHDGARVVVAVDGELFGEYSLFEDRIIDVEGILGYNRLVIENGSAYMEAADCPDKYCMTYKPIAYANENIICLPHRLVVQVEGLEDTKMDGIAR